MGRAPIEDKIAGEFGGKGAILLAAVVSMTIIGAMIWQQSVRVTPSTIIPTDQILGCYKADGWPILRLERNRLAFEQATPFESSYVYRKQKTGAALELARSYAIQSGKNGREAVDGTMMYVGAYRLSSDLNRFFPTQQVVPPPYFQLLASDASESAMYQRVEC
jgi:hypothetical protein